MSNFANVRYRLHNFVVLSSNGIMIESQIAMPKRGNECQRVRSSSWPLDKDAGEPESGNHRNQIRPLDGTWEARSFA